MAGSAAHHLSWHFPSKSHTQGHRVLLASSCGFTNCTVLLYKVLEFLSSGNIGEPFTKCSKVPGLGKVQLG